MGTPGAICGLLLGPLVSPALCHSLQRPTTLQPLCTYAWTPRAAHICSRTEWRREACCRPLRCSRELARVPKPRRVWRVLASQAPQAAWAQGWRPCYSCDRWSSPERCAAMVCSQGRVQVAAPAGAPQGPQSCATLSHQRRSPCGLLKPGGHSSRARCTSLGGICAPTRVAGVEAWVTQGTAEVWRVQSARAAPHGTPCWRVPLTSAGLLRCPK
mmetsp:Transcript_2893/g.10231  ORF Transcript_2893/g.10231 Transcript_2893/m.10231 type:complete len:214 (-) Transcript_2893:5450-6091(-)